MHSNITTSALQYHYKCTPISLQVHSERKLACNHNDLTKCRTPQGGSHYNGTPKYCTGMPNHNLLFPLKLSDRVVMLESLQVYSSVEEAHHNGLYKTSNWIFVRKSLQWHFRAVQMERMLAYNHAQWSQETLPTSLGECSACVISDWIQWCLISESHTLR